MSVSIPAFALPQAAGDPAQRRATAIRAQSLRGGSTALVALIGFVLILLAVALLVIRFASVGSESGATGAAVAGGRAAALPANGAVAAPQVEPVTLLPVTRDDARVINAAIPMVSTPLVAAMPFRYVGTPESRERAITCLATAVLYEAGDDTVGERAVAQVVLNRLRHPAFPKTVCGVVFEGSTRTTGCQFSFTCDGALAREPGRAAWGRARAVATTALAGAVDRSVGLATHYHTDWVVPVWSASLDKIARVGTHLFFRWRGWWGTPRAFSGAPGGEESLPTQIAALSDAPPPLTIDGTTLTDTVVAGAAPPAVSATVAAAAAPDLNGSTLRLADPDTGTYVLHLAAGAFSGDYALAALNLCKGRRDCNVYGYLHSDQLPQNLPLPRGAAAHAAFYYQGSANRAYWDCRTLPRPQPAECMPGTAKAGEGG